MTSRMTVASITVAAFLSISFCASSAWALDITKNKNYKALKSLPCKQFASKYHAKLQAECAFDNLEKDDNSKVCKTQVKKAYDALPDCSEYKYAKNLSQFVDKYIAAGGKDPNLLAGMMCKPIPLFLDVACDLVDKDSKHKKLCLDAAQAVDTWTKAQAQIWKERVLSFARIQKVYKDAGGDLQGVNEFIANPIKGLLMQTLYLCETGHQKKPALLDVCKTSVLAANMICTQAPLLCGNSSSEKGKKKSDLNLNELMEHLDQGVPE